jgi:hypothetical protein
MIKCRSLLNHGNRQADGSGQVFHRRKSGTDKFSITNKNELSAGFHAASFRERNDAIL